VLINRFRTVATLVVVTLTAVACSSSSSSGAKSKPLIQPPNIQALLRLPVATPSVCPSNVNGTTIGRASPWEYTDISLYMTPHASTKDNLVVTRELKTSPYVTAIYFETARQAYAEFQHLYTCWAAVPRSQTPSSYRVNLKTTTQISQRNALVEQLLTLPGVDTITCPAVESCVSVVEGQTTDGTSSPNS
jgi:FtsX extracellular domain